MFVCVYVFVCVCLSVGLFELEYIAEVCTIFMCV
jgi:hypothetical protein